MEFYASNMFVQGNDTNSTIFPPPTPNPDIRYYSGLVKNLNIYLTPLIILLGLVTNTLSLLVFLCTYLTKHSSSIYLASLAIADNGFLLSLAISWLSWINIDLVHRPVICQLTVYMGSVSSFLSVYYVMAFTVERFIAVNFPLKRHVMCTVKRAKIVCFLLAVIALVFYSYPLWTNVTIDIPNGTACIVFRDYVYVVQILSYIDTIVTLLIPSVAIITLNALIAIKIYTTFKHRRTLNAAALTYSTVVSFSRPTTSSSHDDLQSQPGKKNKHYKRKFRQNNQNGSTDCSRTNSDSQTVRHKRNNSAVHATHHPSSSSSQMRTTRLLWIVSSVFVLLNTPSHAFKLHFIYVTHLTSTRLPDTYPLWQECVQLVYYVNFSINFFLYSACAKRFRQGLGKLFRRSTCRRPR